MSESGLLFDACSSTIVTSAPCYTSSVSWSRGNIVLVKHNISRATDHTDQDQVHATAQHLWSRVNNEIFFPLSYASTDTRCSVWPSDDVPANVL